MSITKKVDALNAPGKDIDEKLYIVLSTMGFNPDGRYYMDEDGFGITSDEEMTLYGFIDSEMNVLVKFQYIDEDWKRLDRMRREAVETLKKNSK